MAFTFGMSGAGAAAASRRDSWPPTTLVLSRNNSTKTEPLPHHRLEDIDKDPLTYFLTPTDENMDVQDDDDHAMMDFDAGIEDAARPKQIIRSLSPSSLDALRRRHREPSPDFDDDDDISDDYTSEDDDFLDEDDEEEEEEYIRFAPSPSGSGFFLQPNSTLYNSGVRSRSPVFYPLFGNDASSSFPPPSAPRHSMAGRRGLYRSFSARPGRHGRLWREPSPDVWSIQEETDAQVRSASFSIDTLREGNPVVSEAGRVTPTLRKKVRFILPPKEI